MIAEKILDDELGYGEAGRRFFDDGYRGTVLAAMQSYADFFYWLGKEGWVKLPNANWYNPKPGWIKTEADLYQTYLTNSKPKE